LLRLRFFEQIFLIISLKGGCAIEKRETAKEKERSVVQGKDPSERRVEFVFQSPEAKEVFLAGGFNGWDTQSLPMMKSREGT